MFAKWLSAGAFSVLFIPLSAEPASSELFEERTRCLAYLEFYVQREVDRQPGEGVALVLNEEGLLVTLGHVFPDWMPPDRFRDLRLYPADNPEPTGFTATYLGQDVVNGWHYLRLEEPEAAAVHLDPVAEFASGVPAIGERVWGVGMTDGRMDYLPYYREAAVSAMQPLPLDTWFATTEVSVTGGPVFLKDGRFAGWAGRPMPEERDMWIGQEYFRATLRNPDESYMFLAADVFRAEAGKRVPDTPLGEPRPWIGVAGTEPLDAETSRFMGLTEQGALVISEVLPETPAAEAGLENRDIVLEVGGEPMPRLRPRAVLQRYFERSILASDIGEPLALTVLRGKQRMELEVTPTEAPMDLKEAPLRYFEELGMTIRPMVLRDSLQRREDWREADGVIVNFIRPNSPAATGEVQPGDWVREIGGESVPGFEAAVQRMETIVGEENREEIVLLVERGNETTVLRIRKP